MGHILGEGILMYCCLSLSERWDLGQERAVPVMLREQMGEKYGMVDGVEEDMPE